MKIRLRAAWNALLGRPTIAFVPGPIVLAEPLHLDRRALVCGSSFRPTP